MFPFVALMSCSGCYYVTFWVVQNEKDIFIMGEIIASLLRNNKLRTCNLKLNRGKENSVCIKKI